MRPGRDDLRPEDMSREMINEFFGFPENPFHLTPDPRFLFLTNSHQEALASMIYGIQEKKGFVSILGEVGTGKTTLVRHLLNLLDPRIKTVFIHQTFLSFEELLKEILSELDLPLGDQSKFFLIRRFNDYLIQRLARNETLALLIDDAQNLSKEGLEDLRLLSNLETERFKLLQVVLVGQPELEEKLNSEDLRQLKQRIAIRRWIRPLTEEESRQYMDHRLNKVGSGIQKVFTSDAVSLICRYAKGIPRVINILCDNAFLIGYALQKKKIDEGIVREVLSDMGMRTKEERGKPEMALPAGLLDQSPAALGSFPFAEVSETQQGQTAGVPVESQRLAGDAGKDADLPAFAPKIGGFRKTSWVLGGVLVFILFGFLFKEWRSHPPEKPEKPAIAPLPVLPLTSTKEEVSPPPPQPAARKEKMAKVERGETLFMLAQRYYGQTSLTFVDHILMANPGIADPNRIWENQRIRLPEITEDSLILQGGDGAYRVWLETFLERQQAESLKGEFSSKAIGIEVLPRPVSPEKTWYRAVAGKFSTREECRKSIPGLQEKGLLPVLKKWTDTHSTENLNRESFWGEAWGKRMKP